MLLLDPLDPAFVAIGVAIGVTAEKLRSKPKKHIGSAPPAAPKKSQVIGVLVEAARAAFDRKPFRPRDLWPLVEAEMKAQGIDHKDFCGYLWRDASSADPQFLHTEHRGYYVVTADVVFGHIKPNAIILNHKVHKHLVGPLVAAMLFALSGWWLKPVHLHDILHQTHGLLG